MNVLSLFDGMSCGRIALERAGIEVTNYYASEIDKYAITVSRDNWFDIIHIGDVTKVKAADLPQIDLLIGGSPCQGFSFAGKQLNFNDPRSALFFEYVRIMNEIKAENPDLKIFLENVRMKKEHQDVISSHLGLQPVFIDSALVSAQTRKRLYWSNIHYTGPPADKGIFLKDILETEGTGFIINRNERNERNEKAMCIDANYHKGADNHGQRTLIDQIKSETNRKFDISFHENGNIRPHKLDERKSGISEIGTIVHPNNKSTTHIASHVPNVICRDKAQTILATIHKENYKSMIKRNKLGLINALSYRKLTPVECERLQTVPDNYTSAVSNTQRYKMLGNGWNVDTIVHLFKPLKDADIL
jgi:DNA-cytosine methyltransferase